MYGAARDGARPTAPSATLELTYKYKCNNRRARQHTTILLTPSYLAVSTETYKACITRLVPLNIYDALKYGTDGRKW